MQAVAVRILALALLACMQLLYFISAPLEGKYNGEMVEFSYIKTYEPPRYE